MQGPETTEPTSTPEQGLTNAVSVGNMFIMSGHNNGEPVVVFDAGIGDSDDFSIVLVADKGTNYRGIGTAHKTEVPNSTKVIKRFNNEELATILATAMSSGKQPTAAMIKEASSYIGK